MAPKVSSALLTLLLFMSIAKADNSALRFVYYHDFEPYSISSDAHVHGLFVTLNKHIMEGVLNTKTKHFGMPWARAQQLVKNG